jgi:hypothetical protein
MIPDYAGIAMMMLEVRIEQDIFDEAYNHSYYDSKAK